MLITWLDINICVSFRKINVSMFEVKKKHTKPKLVLTLCLFKCKLVSSLSEDNKHVFCYTDIRTMSHFMWPNNKITGVIVGQKQNFDEKLLKH